MSTLAVDARPAHPPAALFVATTFSSAALVFLVQPMVAKLVLPLLGGSASVWNTSMAFFQIALLAGYGYAHLLQRIASARRQALVHCLALLAAAAALPLRVNGLAGPPSSAHPQLWLLAELALAIGPPFAVLSATAPLVQAWYARTLGAAQGKEPYALYAASNLGSLLALLAYPLAVEPLAPLADQRYGWSAGYLAFIMLMAALALFVTRAHGAAGEGAHAAAADGRTSWAERARWIGLAAIPSSLMLGVTSYITTDVASAPFLWVAPLALYLLTFIVAFQARPAIRPQLTLTLQAAAVAVCAALLPFRSTFFLLQLAVHLAAFFLTALMCHQHLVSRRPEPARLTEFYLCLSVGGVVGGAFNAFLAPVIFDNVYEYPIVLALSCLARPWGARTPGWAWGLLAAGLAAALAAPAAATFANHPEARPLFGLLAPTAAFGLTVKALLMLAVLAAFLLRARAPLFLVLVAVISIGAGAAADRVDTRVSWRSFFGVLRQSQGVVPSLGGPVHMLAHGTTLHGAQARSPAFRCHPLVYYTPHTPIGQVFTAEQKRAPDLRIGAVGLGTGSVAAYVRPSDRLTFFEIDPLVVRVSTDPRYFSYTTECARGRVDYVIGDARLTLARQPADSFDILLIDAFSSDAVPAHLLTVQAVRGYLAKLKPDGVLILHLSNRNLDLMDPAQAVARAAGGWAMVQSTHPPKGLANGWESPEDAVIVARSHQALAPFAADGQWTTADPFRARPWTDDYMNLAGALYAKLKTRWRALP